MSTITRGKLTAILAAMFVVGSAVGSFATVYYFQSQKPWQRRPPTGSEGRGPTNLTGMVTRHISERLSLTEEQTQRLAPTFETLAGEMSQIFSNSFARMDAASQKANEAIRPELSGEEQLKKFEELVRDRRSFMEPWRGGRGRPGGRGDKGEKGDRPQLPPPGEPVPHDPNAPKPLDPPPGPGQ